MQWAVSDLTAVVCLHDRFLAATNWPGAAQEHRPHPTFPPFLHAFRRQLQAQETPVEKLSPSDYDLHRHRQYISQLNLALSQD